MGFSLIPKTYDFGGSKYYFGDSIISMQVVQYILQKSNQHQQDNSIFQYCLYCTCFTFDAYTCTHSHVCYPPPIPHTIGAVVGFNMTTYTADESETVEVCVSILSPNETVLMASAVHGEFNITISGGQATGDYLCLIRLLHS